MKQCPHCGTVTDEDKAACPNCQAGIADEPSLPEPSHAGLSVEGFFPAMGVVFCLMLLAVALATGSWKLFLGAALACFGLSCRTLFVVKGESEGKSIMISLICAIGIILAALAAIFGGCALVFR